MGHAETLVSVRRSVSGTVDSISAFQFGADGAPATRRSEEPGARAETGPNSPRPLPLTEISRQEIGVRVDFSARIVDPHNRAVPAIDLVTRSETWETPSDF